MPVKERILKSIPLSRNGTNLAAAASDVRPGYGLMMRNCYFRRGVQGRYGYVKHSTNAVTAAKAIVGAHRFYGASALRHLIAVAGTNVKYLNEGTGAWTNIRTTQTDGLQTYMTTWAAVNRAYIANGTDVPFSWDGTTDATLTAFPATTRMLLPYRSRLLFLDSANPTYLRWTDADYVTTGVISTAQAIRMVGGDIQAIAPHALAGNQEGINAAVLLFTGSSCAIFFATNLDPASWVQTAGNFGVRLDHLSDTVGTLSPRTVVSTPAGTIFLGTDKQVYLIPYGSIQIIPIGEVIRSGTTASPGIESIPDAQLPKACAAFHDGFYILAYATSGDTTNSQQMWLDVTRLGKTENGEWGPWFGPMTGMSVSCFVTQHGPGDDGRLIAGSGLADGFVYKGNEKDTLADNGAAIAVRYQTHHEFLSDSESLNVAMEQMELEMRPMQGSIVGSCQDTIGPAGQGVTFTPVGTATYWDDAYWGEQDWTGGETPIRGIVRLDDANARGRQMATEFQFSSATERFELFALRQEARLVEGTFADASE